MIRFFSLHYWKSRYGFHKLDRIRAKLNKLENRRKYIKDQLEAIEAQHQELESKRNNTKN